MKKPFAIIITTIFMNLLSRPGNCLQCYECSSLETAKCGATWAFEGTQGDQYKVECHNSATACRKHVSWESDLDNAVVFRSCWNETTAVAYTPSGCTEMQADLIEICYCTDPHRPCNRNNRVTVSVCFVIAWILLSGLLVSITS